MTQIRKIMAKELTIGAAAVNGLLSGLGAGLAMAVLLVAAGWLTGQDPATVLSRFDPAAQPQALTGFLMHLGLAGVYGMLFGIGWHLLGRIGLKLPAMLVGLAFGLALLALAELVILPGTGSLLGQTPLAPFALAHSLYGLTLGWLYARLVG